MDLELISEHLSVLRLAPFHAIPPEVYASGFFSVTRSADELSIFAESRVLEAYPERVSGWRALRVAGMIDLQLPGVISQLALPLATRQIPIFSISTHDTDYILVHEDRLEDALYVLGKAGHAVRIL